MSEMDFSKAVETFKTILSGYEEFWCVAGGWALDFYLDRQTRAHDDMEIVVLRNDSEKLYSHFKVFHPKKIVSGEPPTLIPWNGEQIEPEVVQLRIDPVGKVDFDLLLTPSDTKNWICRREETIMRPLDEVRFFTKCGLPVLAPEIVLLFKAKYMRDKDTEDFLNIAPTMSPKALAWVSNSLMRIHPNHKWINIQ